MDPTADASAASLGATEWDRRASALADRAAEFADQLITRADQVRMAGSFDGVTEETIADDNRELVAQLHELAFLRQSAPDSERTRRAERVLERMVLSYHATHDEVVQMWAQMEILNGAQSGGGWMKLTLPPAYAEKLYSAGLSAPPRFGFVDLFDVDELDRLIRVARRRRRAGSVRSDARVARKAYFAWLQIRGMKLGEIVAHWDDITRRWQLWLSARSDAAASIAPTAERDGAACVALKEWIRLSRTREELTEIQVSQEIASLRPIALRT
jgi:hypothetical protein